MHTLPWNRVGFTFITPVLKPGFVRPLFNNINPVNPLNVYQELELQDATLVYKAKLIWQIKEPQTKIL